MPTNVLIVGAGPTGLVLALWLNRLGVSVRIIDRNAGPGETSRAFAVQARTLEHYDQISAANLMVAAGLQLSELSIHEQTKLIARIELAELGRDLSPFPSILILLQDKHEKLLLGRLADTGVEVDRNTELISFSENAAGVQAWLKGAGGEDELFDSDYICGCDGAYSLVRALIGSDFEGGSYDRTFYVADIVAAGAMADGGVHYAMAGPNLCRVFPLTGRNRLRLIGRMPNETALSHAPATFEDIAPQITLATDLNVSAVEWFSTYPVHHRVATKFRRGRAFLLGDACHSHSPAGSQGLNTGIGDAVNLAWKLSLVLHHRANSSLLDTYESERSSVARKIIKTTDLAFGLQVAPSKAMQFLRLLAARTLPTVMRAPGARTLFFRTISQLGLHYRGRRLSWGCAGGLSGGDRLPWVATGRETDNFAPLRTLDWQVHIYGEASPPLRAACAEMHLPLNVFKWSHQARRKGFQKNALYLIRPDGFVGLASRDQRPLKIRQFFSPFNLKMTETLK